MSFHDGALPRTPPLRVGILLFVVVLLFSGCAQGEQGRFFSDPDQPIDTQVGQAFVVILPSLEAANFEWTLAQEIDPALLQLTASKQSEVHYVNTPDDERNQEFWIFMAMAPGQTTIHLNYANPDGQVQDSRIFAVEIE